jgi:hypothetical protein
MRDFGGGEAGTFCGEAVRSLSALSQELDAAGLGMQKPASLVRPLSFLAGVEVESALAGMPARDETAPGRAAPLGKNADFESPPPPEVVDIHAVLPPPATVRAWYLRSYAREALAGVTNKEGWPVRMRFCGRNITRGFDGVGIYARPDRAYGRVHGVCVCGQSLACPVCAPRIAAFRAAEVAEGFKRAAAAGYEASLVTFTAPHALGSTLGKEIDCFAVAWRRFNCQGKASQKRRRGSLGSQIGRECTYGAAGWHYHHHQLRFDEPGKFNRERTEAQWLAALDSVGRKWRGAELHAFAAGLVGNEAGARYVAKLATAADAQGRAIGLEVAGGSLKGKNLATLLKLAAGGDADVRAIWVAGVRDILVRKVSSVRWSPRLRDRLGMAVEKSDVEIAKEEVVDTDVFLGALSPWQWCGVLEWKAEFPLLIAANQGREAVNSFLAGLELGELNDEDPRLVQRIEINKSRGSKHD